MTQEALDSPGCTRAVITTARRALRAAGSLQKEVMVIRSQAFPARVSQSLRRRRRRTMLGSSRKTERIGQFLRKLSKIGVVQWWEINGDFTAKHASGVEKAASKIVIEPPNVEDFRWSPTILRIWNPVHYLEALLTVVTTHLRRWPSKSWSSQHQRLKGASTTYGPPLTFKSFAGRRYRPRSFSSASKSICKSE